MGERGSARRLARTLSNDETQRANGFRSPRDRDRFVVSRGVLRVLLGGYLRLEPSSLVFSYAPGGKPEVCPLTNATDLRFNCSHSHDRALVAVTRERRIGVDIEARRHLPELERLAQMVLTEGEMAQLRSLPPRQREESFFRCWTRKEAFVKATGEGLQRPLDRVELPLEVRQSASLPAAVRGVASERWLLQDLPAGRNYAAALAVEGRGYRLLRLCYPSGLGA